MQPLLKWPGGKSSEIEYIKDIIPSYDRYIEPFCGGGAVYFYLEPNKAVINDISKNLTDFYMLIKDNKKIRYFLSYFFTIFTRYIFNHFFYIFKLTRRYIITTYSSIN